MEETKPLWQARIITFFKAIRFTLKVLLAIFLWAEWIKNNVIQFGRNDDESDDPSLIEHFFGTPTDV
jgi:hypothetical protein